MNFFTFERCILTLARESKFLLSCLTFPRSNRHFHRSTLDAFKRGALQLKHRARVITRSITPHDFLLSLQGKKKSRLPFDMFTKYVILIRSRSCG